jgi:pimeloyl-ACP methyl ester carboxylesterase
MLSTARYGEDRFAQVRGHRIHYVDVGPGPPVIMVSGSYSTYRTWNRLIPLLADRYRLLALDYLGTGDSDKPKRGFRYTVQEQADLIAELIQMLQTYLPQTRIVGLEGGIHDLEFQQPRQVADLVRESLG